jgi:hypothetical protein
VHRARASHVQQPRIKGLVPKIRSPTPVQAGSTLIARSISTIRLGHLSVMGMLHQSPQASPELMEDRNPKESRLYEITSEEIDALPVTMTVVTGRKNHEQLRDDLEGGAEVVFAKRLCGAEQVAFIVDNHAQRILAVSGSEFMNNAVFPRAIFLR